jgi:phosphotriesterase-related protein
VVDRIAECLEGASAAGVGGLVDVGTELFGPSPLLLLCAATRSAVNIISSTGCFTADMLPPPGWAYPPAGPEAIAEHFIKVVTEGPAKSGVKPGIIKIGTGGRAISAVEENVFRGAALAQQATGLAITTHTQFTRFALEQVDLLEDAGADLDRVVIGHIGWGSGVDDFDLHERLVSRGVSIGLDCVGSPARSDEDYARITLDLVEAGYASQLVFSHDGVALSRGLLELFGPEWLTGDFSIVTTRLVPILREKGIGEDHVNQMMVRNPARILTIDPVRYPGSLETVLKPVEVGPLEQFDYTLSSAHSPTSTYAGFTRPTVEPFFG